MVGDWWEMWRRGVVRWKLEAYMVGCKDLEFEIGHSRSGLKAWYAWERLCDFDAVRLVSHLVLDDSYESFEMPV